VSPLVIFDCDGVLVDSEILVVEIEAALLADAGVAIGVAGVVDRYVGLSEADMVSAIVDEFGDVIDRAFVEGTFAGLRDRRVSEALATRLQPIAGIDTVLEALSSPLCLASSSHHDRIAASLATTGLLGFFPPHCRFSATDVEHGKPAPDLFLHAAAVCGHDPSTCVVVEDSPHGVRAALAAGMAVIGFAGGGHHTPAFGRRLLDAGAPMVVPDAEALGRALGDHDAVLAL
jgi:HAD superfamily hydrolase (TIGR01509 family)